MVMGGTETLYMRTSAGDVALRPRRLEGVRGHVKHAQAQGLPSQRRQWLVPK